jgi:hypothetical protein
MSMHGFFLCTDEAIEPGSLMQLNIALGERTIPLFGTSRFVGRTLAGQGIGVELFLIDEESRALWLSYYHARLAADAKPAVAESPDSAIYR